MHEIFPAKEDEPILVNQGDPETWTYDEEAAVNSDGVKNSAAFNADLYPQETGEFNEASVNEFLPCDQADQV